MKKEVIIVPKDKCPLDVLAEMGEQIRTSWIFIHENAFHHLRRSEGAHSSAIDRKNANRIAVIYWEATKEHPKTEVSCEIPVPKGWGKITHIDAEDICFGMSFDDPENIYFLKMEE